METKYVVYAVLFGLLWGSFLSVLISRLKHDKKGIFFGRSKCELCQKLLKPWHLIPVFSWLWARGCCGMCGERISWWYPVYEVLGAMVLGLTVYAAEETGRLLGLKMLLVMGCFALFLYDWRYQLVDRRISFPVIVLAAFYAVVKHESVTPIILGASIGYLWFAVQYYGSLWLSPKRMWVGKGDLELGIVLGLLAVWPFTITTLFLSYFIGVFCILGLILIQKIGGKEIPKMYPMGAFLLPALWFELWTDFWFFQTYLSWSGLDLLLF